MLKNIPVFLQLIHIISTWYIYSSAKKYRIISFTKSGTFTKRLRIDAIVRLFSTPVQQMQNVHLSHTIFEGVRDALRRCVRAKHNRGEDVWDAFDSVLNEKGVEFRSKVCSCLRGHLLRASRTTDRIVCGRLNILYPWFSRRKRHEPFYSKSLLKFSNFARNHSAILFRAE